jgi:hypothetical protein
MSGFGGTFRYKMNQVRDSNSYLSKIGKKKIGNYTLDDYAGRIIGGIKDCGSYLKSHPKTTAAMALSEAGVGAITGCEAIVLSDPFVSGPSYVPQGTTIIPPYVPHIHSAGSSSHIIETENLFSNPRNAAALGIQILLLAAPIIYSGVQLARCRREIKKIEECNNE